jgi:hypothetical protein
MIVASANSALLVSMAREILLPFKYKSGIKDSYLKLEAMEEL